MSENKTGDSDRSEDTRHDHELSVETAPFWQELNCPGCGGTFDEILREGTAVRGSTCPECNDMILYRFDRSEGSEDTTEQTTLFPDGGTSDSERERVAESIEIIDSQTDEYDGEYDLRLCVGDETFYLTIGAPDLDFKFALESAKRGGIYTPDSSRDDIRTDGGTTFKRRPDRPTPDAETCLLAVLDTVHQLNEARAVAPRETADAHERLVNVDRSLWSLIEDLQDELYNDQEGQEVRTDGGRIVEEPDPCEECGKRPGRIEGLCRPCHREHAQGMVTDGGTPADSREQTHRVANSNPPRARLTGYQILTQFGIWIGAGCAAGVGAELTGDPWFSALGVVSFAIPLLLIVGLLRGTIELDRSDSDPIGGW